MAVVLGVSPGLRAAFMMAVAPGLCGLYEIYLGGSFGYGKFFPCRAARVSLAGDGVKGSL